MLAATIVNVIIMSTLPVSAFCIWYIGLLTAIIEGSPTNGHTVSSEKHICNILSTCSRTRVCCALYSVLTSRIVLDIRYVAKRTGGMLTELHGYEETVTCQAVIPMQFRSADTNETGTALHSIA